MKASREFQVFVKPAGSLCNLSCTYCYYLEKEHLFSHGKPFRMSDDILEKYIIQHIEASTEPVIQFSWHGGEPTVLGVDYFRNVVDLQRKHRPAGRRIVNGMQTNGTLIDEEWSRFLAEEHFMVGISLDGPQEMHNLYRVTKDQKPTYDQAVRGFQLLKQHGVLCEILCVVNHYNVQYPIQVYRFFKKLEAKYISFLPLVEPHLEAREGVSSHTVPSEAFGDFLCTIFDEWAAEDIGQIKVQIFEEAARTAFGQGHTLCIFRKICGGVPVIEHNGDFYSCDHFVDAEHYLGNITEMPLVKLLDSPSQRAFGRAKLNTLPSYCHTCEVKEMCNGECPKNRFLQTPDSEDRLNYLCAGYKRFFTHCRPFVTEVAAQWQRQNLTHQNLSMQVKSFQSENRRNDPCPCGSGMKFKNCCMKK